MSDLPPGWEWTTLGEVIGAGLFSDGDWVESKDQDADGDVRLLQLADVGEGEFRDRSDRHLTARTAETLRCTYVAPGDVLVARMPDPLGRACLVPQLSGPSVTVVDVCIIRPTQGGVDPRWLMWTINAPQVRSQMAPLQSGTTRKRISRKNLATVQLLVPPRAEQERIVAAIEEHLSQLDAAEDGLRRAKLGLGRFEAAALVESVELEGAASVRLGDLCVETLVGLVRSRKVQGVESGVPYVRMQDITTDGRVLIDQLTSVSASIEELSRYQLRAGDLLFNTRNSVELVGKTAIVPPSAEGAVFNNNLMRIRLDARVLPEFALMQFISPGFRRRLGSATSATTSVAAIYAKSLLPLELVVPPLDVQARAVREFSELREGSLRMADAAEHGVRRVSAVRRAVLAAAFSGQLVPQNPDDEPASVLLDRIRAERVAATPKKRTRKAKAS